MRYQLLINQIKQQNKPSALSDLQVLFADKINSVKRQYPALTDTDIQVLTLIGLGVGNADILQFTDMSKRTYYKRRQLIAQRMNTTAAQLDELAKQLFTSK
jgi:FixJ family two-component response regulator